MTHLDDHRRALLELSRELGAPARQLAILGEGNTSARLDDETFLVKASGSNLATLSADDLVACRFEEFRVLSAQPDKSDEAVSAALLASRLDASARTPSIETLFHAALLELPDVRFVGHTHPIAINAILCSPRAEQFAAHRLCPDEVVCCGPRWVLVPYADPGLPLARCICNETRRFLQAHGCAPRVILLQNHGIITLGPTPAAVQAAMFMAVKAAEIFLRAVALGEPVFLSEQDVERIASRRDEHHRQRALGL